MRKEDSQSIRVLRYLEKGNRISSFEAYAKFHVTRLPALIWILKNDGYDIESAWVDVEDGRENYKEYWLKGADRC